MRHAEYQEAVVLADWMRHTGLFFCHVPNEFPGGAKRAAQNKRMGVRPGMPDYLIFDAPPCGQAVGCAVELKRKGGRQPSTKQRETLDALLCSGWVVVVSHGADEAIEQLRSIGYGR